MIHVRPRYRVRVEPVTADDTRKRVDDAYRAKYRGQGAALRQVVSSPARDYTLRVVLEEEPAVPVARRARARA